MHIFFVFLLFITITNATLSFVKSAVDPRIQTYAKSNLPSLILIDEDTESLLHVEFQAIGGGELSVQYRSGGLHMVTWNSTSSTLSFKATPEVANRVFPFVYFTPKKPGNAIVKARASRDNEEASIDLNFKVDVSNDPIRIDMPSSVVIDEDSTRVIDFCTFLPFEIDREELRRFDAVVQVDKGSFLITGPEVTSDETMSIANIHNKTLDELQITIQSLTYVPEENYHSSSTIHSVMFAITTTTTVDGSVTTSEDTQIFVRSVNDAPIIEQLVEELSVTVGRRISLRDTFVIHDADFSLHHQSEDSLRVTVKVQHGALELMSSDLNIVTNLPNGFRVAGTPDSVNEAISMLTYMYSGEEEVVDVLEIQVQDREDAIVQKELTIRVLSSRSGPRLVSTVVEDVLQLQENVPEILSVGNVVNDDMTTLVELTIRATYGVVTVPTFKQMQFFEGNGEQNREMRFVASVDATNRVLSHLTYVLQDSPSSSSSLVEDHLDIEIRAVDETTKMSFSNEVLDSIHVRIDVSRSVPETDTIASLELPSSTWTLSVDEDETLELSDIELRDIFGDEAYDLYERVDSVTLEFVTDLGRFRVPTSTPRSSMDKTMCVKVVPPRAFETYKEHNVNSFHVKGTLSAVQNSISRASYYAGSNTYGTAQVTMNLSYGDDAVLSRVISIEIRSVNDAPRWGLSSSQEERIVLSCNETTRLPSMSVHDIEAEAESAVMSVTLSAARGTIRMDSSSNIKYVVGNEKQGHQVLRFTGLVTDLNTALSQGVFYTAPSTASSLGDFDEVVFRVDDMGSSGQGGSLHAEKSVLIQVEPPNRDVQLQATFEGIRYVENSTKISIGSSIIVETEGTFGLLGISVLNGDLLLDNDVMVGGLSCSPEIASVVLRNNISVQEEDDDYYYCAGSIETLVRMLQDVSCSPHNMDSVVTVKFIMYVQDGSRWHQDSVMSQFSLYPNAHVLPIVRLDNNNVDTSSSYVEVEEDDMFELSRVEFQGEIVESLVVRLDVSGGSLKCSHSNACSLSESSSHEIREEKSLSSLNQALSHLAYVPSPNMNSLHDKDISFEMNITISMQRNESNSKQKTIQFFVLPTHDPPEITIVSSNLEVHTNEIIKIEGIMIHDEDKAELQHMTISVSHGSLHLDRMFGLRLVEQSETSIQVVGTSESLTRALESLSYVASSQEGSDTLEIQVEDSSLTRTSRTCTILTTFKPKQPVLIVPETTVRVHSRLENMKIEYDRLEEDLGLTVCASEGCVCKVLKASEEECVCASEDACVRVEDKLQSLNLLLKDKIRYVRNKNESYDDKIYVDLEFRDDTLTTISSTYKVHVSAMSIQYPPELVVPTTVELSMHDAFQSVILLSDSALLLRSNQDDVLELDLELQGQGVMRIGTIVPGIRIEIDDVLKSKRIKLRGTSSRLNIALETLTYELESDISDTLVEDSLVWKLNNETTTTRTKISIYRECRKVVLLSRPDQEGPILESESSIANIGSGVSVRVDDGRPCGNRTILEMIWSSVNDQGRVFVNRSFENCLVDGSGTSQLRLRCSLVENVQSEVVQHVKYELDSLLPVRPRVDVVKITARFRDLRDLSNGDQNEENTTTLSVPVFVSASSRNLTWSNSNSIISGHEDTTIALSNLRLSPVRDVDVLIHFTIQLENPEHGYLRLAASRIPLSNISGDGTYEITFEASSFLYDENDALILDDVVEFVPTENWSGESSIRVRAGSGQDALDRLVEAETNLFVLVESSNDTPLISSSWCTSGTMLYDSQVLSMTQIRVADPEVSDILRLSLSSHVLYLSVEENSISSSSSEIRFISNSQNSSHEVILEGTPHDLNTFLERSGILASAPSTSDKIWIQHENSYRTSQSERVLQDELTIRVSDGTEETFDTCAMHIAWTNRAPKVVASSRYIQIEDDSIKLASISNVAFRVALSVQDDHVLTGADDLLDATYRRELNVWGLVSNNNETSLTYFVSARDLNVSLEKIRILQGDVTTSTTTLYYDLQEHVPPSLRAIHTIQGNVTLDVQPSADVVTGVVIDTNMLLNASELSRNSLYVTVLEDSEIDLSGVFQVVSSNDDDTAVNVTFHIDQGAQIMFSTLYVTSMNAVDDILLVDKGESSVVRLSISDNGETVYTNTHQEFMLRGPVNSINTVLNSGITLVLKSDFTGVSKLSASLTSVPFSTQAEISVFVDERSDPIVFSSFTEEKQRVEEDGRLNLVMPTLRDVDILENLELTISTSVGKLEIPSLVRLGLRVVSETSVEILGGGLVSEITVQGTSSKLNAFLQDVWFVPESDWHSDRTRLNVERNDQTEYVEDGSLDDVIEIRVQTSSPENVAYSRLELRALSTTNNAMSGTFFLSVDCSSEVIDENDTTTSELTGSVNISSPSLEDDLREAIASAFLSTDEVVVNVKRTGTEEEYIWDIWIHDGGFGCHITVPTGSVDNIQSTEGAELLIIENVPDQEFESSHVFRKIGDGVCSDQTSMALHSVSVPETSIASCRETCLSDSSCESFSFVVEEGADISAGVAGECHLHMESAVGSVNSY